MAFNGVGGQLNINTVQHIANISSGDLNPITFSNGVLLLGAANVDDGIGTNFSGTGSIVKNGSANLTIGFGPADSFAGNNDTSLNFTVNAGTLILNKAPGTNAIAGSLAINGGVALLASSNQIADNSFLSLSNGTFNLNGFNETVGNLSGTGGTVAVGSGTFTVAENSFSTYSGALSGSGTFIKSGTGNLTLAGSGSFGGAFVVNNGRLILQGGISGASYSIANGATLRFSGTTINAGSSAIQPGLGGTVEYTNSVINGGFLDGPGTHTLLANSTFSGSSAMSGTTLNQTGNATLTNFTSGAIFNNNAPLTWAFGTNAPSGVLNINSTTAVSGFTNSGVINIAVGASLTNSLTNLVLGGGSRTYLGNIANHGGTISLSAGTTLEVNGALLVNDGTISGTTNVNFGGVAQGVGSYGPVNVTFGGTFQPGFASSGIVNNAATITQLSGSGTIDNTSTGNMTLTLTGSSNLHLLRPHPKHQRHHQPRYSGQLVPHSPHHPALQRSQSINTFSGGLSIASGASVTIGAVGALPTASVVINNGSLTINANATAGVISGLGSLSVGPGSVLSLAPSSGTTKQGAISLTPTSTLNLANNFLILEAPDSVTKGTDITKLTAQVASGATTAFGITTSPLAPNLAVAVIDNGSLLNPLTTFGGQPVDNNSILIAPELLGNSNIDGRVDLNDLNTVLNHLGTTNAGWTWGGFDGQPAIDLNDLNDVLNHLGLTYANSSAVIAAEAILPSKSESTPEPGTLTLLAFSSVVLFKRGRRTKSRIAK